MYADSNSLSRKCSVAMLLIFLLPYVAGCGPSATQPPTGTPTNLPAELPTAAATETPVPSLTSVPTQTPFIPKATIKIVAHLPLSGEQSDAGTDLQQAAGMAVQELADPLNNLGYQVNLVSYDDQMSIDVAVANAKEIIADPQVLCGVGHYASYVMVQASELYHKAGLAFVSPSNTSTTVTDRGYLEVNRLVGREDVHGIAAAQFVKSHGFSSVYVIQSPWNPGQKNADYFKREADRIGINVVGMLTTAVSDDFSSIVVRVMNLKPDLVYFAGLAGQAGPFFRQARAAGYAGTFFTIDGNPALAELAGPLLTDGGGTYYVDTSAPIEAFPGAAPFAKDFNNRYGTVPRPFAAQAYDATGVCLKAIEETVKAKGGELPTRREVAEAIRALVDYPGITGTYNFNKRGDPTLASYFVYKVTTVDSARWPQNELVATLQIAPPQ
jgi:branched-chain amino acid transport system substrate-binding protein